MKKQLRYSALFLLSFLLTGNLFGQLDNLANMSAEWVRTGNRNAAINGADIANYNPSGLTLMADGFHLNLSNQFLKRSPKHSFNLGTGENSFAHEGIDPFLPGFYASFKKNRLALYTGTYIAGGGGSINYPSGSISTSLIGNQILQNQQVTDFTLFNDQNLNGSSSYLAVIFGGAYKLNTLISLSAGVRYLNASKNTTAGLLLQGSQLGLPNTPVKLDIDESATGFGGVFGLSLAPSKEINLSLHYETRVKLDFETKINTDDTNTFTDGEFNRRDLPAALYLGLHVQLNEEVWAEGNFTYYYQTLADWSKTTDDQEWSNIAGDSYKAGLVFGYKIAPKMEFSFGGVFTGFNFDNKELYFTKFGSFEVLKYNYLSLNTGIGYTLNEKITLNLGIARSFWTKGDIRIYDTYDVSVKNSAWVGAIGLNINIFGKNEEKGVYYY